MQHIKKPVETFEVDYPTALTYMDTQLTKCFWTHQEVDVKQDLHNIHTECTQAERHGIETVLKLFTIYEQKAGAEYWTGRFMNTFQRHELQAMASSFGMMELCVHRPFYSKINDLLYASNPEFYLQYKEDSILRNRMKTIDEIIDHPDDLVSLAGFVFVEGAILYSSFAFLKHFQSNGKNKLMNVVRGINFSARDENLHAEAGAWVYRTLRKQSDLNALQIEVLENKIFDIAQTVLLHEFHIIERIFDKGEIDGISKESLRDFVIHRVNKCLSDLSINKHFPNIDLIQEEDKISNWFYKGINNYQHNDFFAGQGREYVRKWDADAFIWRDNV